MRAAARRDFADGTTQVKNFEQASSLMIGGRSVLALVVVALMAAPAALAAQATIDIRADLPITVEGDHIVDAPGAFAIHGDQGVMSLLVEGHQGTLERVIHRAFGYIKADEPQLGVLMEQRVEREEVPMDGAYLAIEERLPTFNLLAYDADIRMEPGARQAPLHLGALEDSRRIESTAEPPLQLAVGQHDAAPFVYTLRAGLYESRAMDGRILAEGAFDLYLEDAVVAYTGPTEERILQAHFREEQRPGTLYDPTTRQWIGGGSHTEYVHEYHVLRITDGKLQAQYLDSPAILYADAPTVSVTGTALFPAAEGTVTVTEDDATTQHDLAGEDLEVAGAFTFTLDALDNAHQATAVDGEGDITQVTYAAESHQYDWTAVAMAGLGALLLGALAWASGAAKWLFAAVGGLFTGYARVSGEEILEHPGRLEVYERIKADPGMHFMDLCERLDFGASTLNYHLRVLERNGYVTRVKDGRYVRFFDRQDGSYSRDRKVAASTLRNDTTAKIAAHIIQNPGVAQRDLAKCFGIAASTVSWHIGRLQKDGLVEKQRDQHFTRYYMGRAWSELPAAELSRVGLVA